MFIISKIHMYVIFEYLEGGISIIIVYFTRIRSQAHHAIDELIIIKKIFTVRLNGAISGAMALHDLNKTLVRYDSAVCYSTARVSGCQQTNKRTTMPQCRLSAGQQIIDKDV